MIVYLNYLLNKALPPAFPFLRRYWLCSEAVYSGQF